MVQILLFFAVLMVAGYLLFQRIQFIRKNISFGLPIKFDGQAKERFMTMLLVAFGQKKMFRRIIPAILHLIVYTGFIIINIEVIEFLIDGLTGSHRSLGHLLNNLSSNPNGYNGSYNVIMNFFEFMALGVMISCVVFLIRRNILKVKRFTAKEMTRWPLLDANLILVFEIILVLAILTMNGADQLLQLKSSQGYLQTGPLYVSTLLTMPILNGIDVPGLVLIERFAWWFHIVGILGFAVYVTYSKHLHIFMAFPNTYFSNLNPPAVIPNMEAVTAEVKTMLGIDSPGITESNEVPRLGAKDIHDLSWKQLMEAYTCTECGRCTSVCPANQTGKLLSPRKIMMDVRDRMEELGRKRDKGILQDEHSLFDYISREELFACTTCNACIDICPVNIDPVSIIIQLRRYTAMEESTSPAAWNMMFNNMETNFAPWKFPAADRFKWAEEIRTD